MKRHVCLARSCSLESGQCAGRAGPPEPPSWACRCALSLCPHGVTRLCMCVLIPSSYQGIRPVGSGPTPRPHFTSIPSLKALYPNIVTLGARTSTYEFWGHNEAHHTRKSVPGGGETVGMTGSVIHPLFSASLSPMCSVCFYQFF